MSRRKPCPNAASQTWCCGRSRHRATCRARSPNGSPARLPAPNCAAALRAEGLVVTRQGAGAFVAPDVERRPFRLALDGLPSIGEVLEIMELRASVEVE